MNALDGRIDALENSHVSDVKVDNASVVDSSGVANIALPTVNDKTLTIQKNGVDVQKFTANSASDKTANIIVPTNTSELTNDSNFISGASLANVAVTGDYDDLLNRPTFGVNTITAGQTSGMVAGHVYAYSAYDAVTGETLIIDAKHTQTNPPYTQFSIASAYSNNIVVLYIKGA